MKKKGCTLQGKNYRKEEIKVCEKTPFLSNEKEKGKMVSHYVPIKTTVKEVFALHIKNQSGSTEYISVEQGKALAEQILKTSHA